MNTKATLGVAAVVTITLAIPLILLNDAESPDPNPTAGDESFAAFSDELPEPADERAANKPADDDKLADGAERPQRAVADNDDTLNRTGPLDREVPAGRTVKNVRPNPGLQPGLQGEAADRASDRESVRRGVETLRPVLRACYDGLRGDFPDASGNITVSFQLIDEDGKGRVDMGEIKAENSTLFDEKFHDCVLEGIGDSEFAPPTKSPLSVTYPFIFSPSDTEE